MCNLMYDCSMICEQYHAVSAFQTVAQGTRHMSPHFMMVLESSGPLQAKGYQVVECTTAF